jgi:hypothetical protein
VGGPQRAPLRFDAMHHEYIGVAACGLGAVTHSRIVTSLGASLALDDGLQHGVQRISGDLSFRSPLTLGYQVTLGTSVPMQQLNRWLDTLFGNLF